VVHTYIPIYSGDRDQEERSSNPAWANSFQDPLLEKPLTKRAGGVVQSEVQAPVLQKKKRKKERKEKKTPGDN
jgi:hypothetical protein